MRCTVIAPDVTLKKEDGEDALALAKSNGLTEVWPSASTGRLVRRLARLNCEIAQLIRTKLKIQPEQEKAERTSQTTHETRMR